MKKKISNKVTRVFSKVTAMLLVFAMVITLLPMSSVTAKAATAEEDMATIKQRLIDYFLSLDNIDDDAKVETCYVSKAETYLEALDSDGKWADCNYTNTASAANGVAWGPYLALDRMQAMAIAYQHPDHQDKKDELLEGLDKALKYWKSVYPDAGWLGPYSTNWWENRIGVQLRFARIAIFVEQAHKDGKFSDESWNLLHDKLFLKKGYGPDGDKHGQNALWLTQNEVYGRLIENNATELKKVIDERLSLCLNKVYNQNYQEGVQVDNSFMFHGRLFYGNGYGMAMFRDMSFWIYMLRDTQFALDDSIIDMMGDYMLNGLRWTIRWDLLEPYHGYKRFRDYAGYPNYAYEYKVPVERMIASDPNPERVEQYKALLANLKGESRSNGLDGSYYMWRADYASHMRENFSVNVKMDSRLVTGGEWRGDWSTAEAPYTNGNYGNTIYWASSSATTVMVKGDEYVTVYPNYDWKHVPGTTTPTVIPSGSGFQSGSSLTTAVNDGTYGATMYVMNKMDTQGKKSVFFFDDEYVALGADITSNRSESVNTTLNQAKAKDVTVGYADGTTATVASGTDVKNYSNTKWLYNNGISYVFPEATDVSISNKHQENPSLWPTDYRNNAADTFLAYVDHGVKPANDSYAFIVHPEAGMNNINAEDDITLEQALANAAEYAENNKIEILSNTGDIQAVRHNGLKLTEITFFKAGQLDVGNGETIAVDFPCAVIVDESGAKAKISVAIYDDQPGQHINVTITRDGKQTVTNFITREKPYAGQSITLSEGKSSADIDASSSYVEPYEPANSQDGDESTYWQSAGNKDEWIILKADATGAAKMISDLSIKWGDSYATKYTVQISNDGSNWRNAASVTDGDGDTDTIEINEVASWIRISCTESSGDCFQIKEVETEGLVNLAYKKEAGASSQYNDDLKLAHVNDGSLNTRWASDRSAGAWVYIDLGDYYKLDTVNLFWEAAYCTKYNIDVSDDGVNWTTAKAITNANGDQNDLGQINHRIDFGEETVVARYVRMQQVEAATRYGSSLYEFEVYGTPSEAEETLVDDYTDFSKLYAYSGNWTVGEVPASNPEGREGSSVLQRTNTSDAYLVYRVDGLSSFKLNAYKTTNPGTQNGTFSKFEISENGEDWVTITPEQSNPDGMSTKFYKDIYESSKLPEGTNYLRITVTGGNKSWTPQLSSLELRYPKGKIVKLTEISFDDAEKYVDIHKTATLAPVLKPMNASEDIVWTSSNPEIVEVSQDGKLTPKAVGTATITAGNTDGSITGSIEIHIVPRSIATGKPATASASLEGYGPENAFDDNSETTSRWAPPYLNIGQAERDANWLQVDLEETYKLSEVHIEWEVAYGKEYEIQVSETGEDGTWVTAAHVTSGTPRYSAITLDEGTSGRFVRFQGIEGATANAYNIIEFKVYGEKFAASESVAKLESTVSEAEKTYTDASAYKEDAWKTYADALAEAKKLVEDGKVTQEQVDAAQAALDAAIQNLANNKIASAETVAKLNETVTKAEKDYTDASAYKDAAWKTYADALADAKAVLADESATQEQVDAAQTALDAAIQNLEENKKIIETTIVDDYADFSKLYAYSKNWTVGEVPANNPEGREGSSVLQRTNTSEEYLVYRVDGLSSFKLTAYQTNLVAAGTFKFEVSPSGEDGTWTTVTPAHSNPDGTNLKFYKDIYDMAELAEGMNYLRITVSGGGRAWTPQLSSLELRYPKDKEVKLAEISFDDAEKYVDIHKTATLAPVLKPMNASENIVWTSSDPEIVEVSQDGKLTPKAVGTATITAGNTDGSITGSIEIHIVPRSIATGKPATASASLEGYGPENAFDDNSETTSRWAPPYLNIGQAERDANWLQVDLEETYKLFEVHIEWEVAYGKEYEIQVSETGEDGTWVTAAHVTNGTPRYSAITLDEGTSGRFVRFQGIEGATANAYNIIEFKVYGEKVVVEPDVAEPETVAKLESTVSEAENKYTDASAYEEEAWNVYEKALADAKEVLEDEKATQEQVDAAQAALDTAIQNLEEHKIIFTDVSPDSRFYKEITWAYKNGITSGRTATTFEPLANCTRGQVVTFLWRVEGCPEPTITKNPFTDVDETSPYYKAILWAYENEITIGRTATTFQPREIVTREQMVTFIWRNEGKPVSTIDNPFVDVAKNRYSTPAILWAYENGVTTGKTETTFEPGENLIRQHAVTFLYNAYEASEDAKG